MKRLITFDLDGTLAESKSPVTSEMGSLLGKLLEDYQVAIISGGAWDQFKKQLIPAIKYKLNRKQLLNLTLMPTSGASMYRWKIEDSIDGWTNEKFDLVYEETISPKDAAKILPILNSIISIFDYPEVHGNQIENRGTQITFSALGQQAPLHIKKAWDPDVYKRNRLVELLKVNLPEFEIRFGGTTSIDITKKNIDKSFGMVKVKKLLNVQYQDILYIGDALQSGGNDHPVKELGIECREVSGPNDTVNIINQLSRRLNGLEQAASTR